MYVDFNPGIKTRKSLIIMIIHPVNEPRVTSNSLKSVKSDY